MKIPNLSSLSLLILIATMVLTGINVQANDENDLPYVEIKTLDDMAALGLEALAKNKVIMLEISASYCGYCRTLEEEIIKPMLRSGDYVENVLIRKMQIDSHYSMNNINGSKTSPAELARQFNIYVTPTLIFLDGNGREVSERILGVNSLDYYGAYVDEALLKGQQTILQN